MKSRCFCLECFPKNSFRRRLLHTNMVLLLIAASFMIVITYLVTQNLYIRNSAVTYTRQMDTLRVGLESKLSTIDEFTQALSQNRTLVANCERLLRGGMVGTAGARASVTRELNAQRQSMDATIKVYLKAGPYVFDEIRLLEQNAASAPFSRNRNLRCMREQALLRDYVRERYDIPVGREQFTAPFGE